MYEGKSPFNNIPFSVGVNMICLSSAEMRGEQIIVSSKSPSNIPGIL